MKRNIKNNVKKNVIDVSSILIKHIKTRKSRDTTESKPIIIYIDVPLVYPTLFAEQNLVDEFGYEIIDFNLFIYSIDDKLYIDMKYADQNTISPYDNYILHFTESNIDQNITEESTKDGLTYNAMICNLMETINYDLYVLNENLNSEYVLDLIITFVFGNILTLSSEVVNEYFRHILSNNSNRLGKYIKSKRIKTVNEPNNGDEPNNNEVNDDTWKNDIKEIKNLLAKLVSYNEK